MTNGELRAALAELKLTQAALARLADVNIRTVRRWVSGYTPVPHYVTIILEHQRYGKA
jgi:transcriptional regulator with XRE-family HTH domain